MGFILALILAAALALLAATVARNDMTLELLAGYRITDMQVWELLVATALSATIVAWFVAWVFGLRTSFRLKREIRRRDQEIKDTQQRLAQAHDNLQQYEAQMHEFALKVMEMAHRQLPPSPEEAADELVGSFTADNVEPDLETPDAPETAPVDPVEAQPADDRAEETDQRARDEDDDYI